jgi:hypothetical protein
MFLDNQPKNNIDYYKRLLNSIGSLSSLFSEAPEPYLASRVTENIFCKAFVAENLSRSDVSADASKDRLGFGIKTFIEGNGKSLQKVAEFNSDHQIFASLAPEEKINKIAELRNERIETTKRIFKLDNLIYHCVARRVGKIIIFETPVHLIDMETIKNVKTSSRGNTIQFSDLYNQYSFNITKSTLYKRFITDDILLDVPVKILSNPFDVVEKLISEQGLIFSPIKVHPHVFLPLYSVKGGNKIVPEKSGLNQWNASGRPRDPNEIYIPIPSWIHNKFSNFFPPRDQIFGLTLPDKTTMSAKLCQDNSKALMSNPNSALGQWLLRDILNLQEREILTYEKLETIGLDTVVVYKIDNEHYDIDFARIGSYENFKFEHDESGGEEEQRQNDE